MGVRSHCMEGHLFGMIVGCSLILRPTKGDAAGATYILHPLTPLAGCGAATTLPLHGWPCGHRADTRACERAAGRCAKAPAGADMECPST